MILHLFIQILDIINVDNPRFNPVIASVLELLIEFYAYAPLHGSSISDFRLRLCGVNDLAHRWISPTRQCFINNGGANRMLEWSDRLE